MLWAELFGLQQLVEQRPHPLFDLVADWPDLLDGFAGWVGYDPFLATTTQAG